MKNIKRMLSLLLVFCLLLSFSATAFAEEENSALTEAAEATTEQDGAVIMPRAYQNGNAVTVYNTFTQLTLDGYYGEWGHKYGSFPCLATVVFPYGETVLPSGGEWIYCIEFETTATQGSTKFYTLENCDHWKNLTDIARSGITYALMYGCPYSVNNLYAYAATQVIVWEYQLGLRTTPTDTPSASSGKGFYGTLSSSSQVKSAYDTILAEMAKHMVKPGIDGSKVTLKGFGRANGVTITDAKSILQYDHWTISGSVPGLHIEQSGNSLFLYADDSFGANASKNVTLVRKAPTAAQVALGAYAGAQFVCIGRPNDPMTLRLTVETESNGTMQLSKTTTAADGKVDGYEFRIWSGAANTTWHGRSSDTGAIYEIDGVGGKSVTGSDGDPYTFEGLLDGKYAFRELLSQRPDEHVFPDSWVVTVTDRSGKTVYTHAFTENELHRDTNGDCYTDQITVTGLTSGGRMTVAINNTPTIGDLEIVKLSDDDNVENISFTIEEWVSGIGYVRIGTYTTDAGGKITVPNLSVGTKYRVTETVPENYEAEQQSQEITIQIGTNTLTFVNHLAVRDLEIIKTSPDGKVSGIAFTVKDSSGKVVGTGKSDRSGKLTVPGLRIGSTYTVTETVPEGYICTKNPQAVTIVEGKNTVTFENRPIIGSIELTKVDEEYPDHKLTGAVFGVTVHRNGYVSNRRMTEVLDAQGNGTGVYRLDGLGYGSVCEIREVSAPEGFARSEETFTVTILEEKTYTVSSANFDCVTNRPIKGSLKIEKVDRDGKTPLAGAGYRVFDGDGKKVAEGYTDRKGELTFTGLRYGSYTYQEFVAPEGFELDDTVYDFSVLQDGQVISVQRENDAEEGSIRIYKVNAEGRPLSGVSFLLEYSIDGGKTYQPVVSRGVDDPVSVGCCTSKGLQDGVLITDKDGIAVFTGLRINTQIGSICYRLTETETQADYQLLTAPAFEGELSADDEIDVEITVVNNHSYALPATGSTGFPFITLSVPLIGLAALILVISLRKKKQGV